MHLKLLKITLNLKCVESFHQFIEMIPVHKKPWFLDLKVKVKLRLIEWKFHV